MRIESWRIMNNRLKFRVWDKESKVMLNEMDVFDFLKLDKGCIHYRRFFENSEVMQFTGIQDKNGKNIFEGDIVLLGYSTSDVEWKGLKAEVVYWCHGFFFKELLSGSFAQDTFYQFKYCEVIGNIHENKNLLTDEI